MKNRIGRRPLCFLCLLFTGIVLGCLSFAGLPSPDLPEEGIKVSITGKVAEKEIKNNKQIFYLQHVRFSDMNFPKQSEIKENKEKEYNIGAVCYLEDTEDISEYPVGSWLGIEGTAACYRQATNPGMFDARRYYELRGYYFSLQNASITGVIKGRSGWRDKLWNLKQRAGSLLDCILMETDASIMKAIVLGDKSDLSGEIKQLYQKNGIAHVLAISGLHISILGTGLYRALKKCHIRKTIAAVIAFFFLLNYALLTGAGTSTIRAVVMLSCYLGADLCNRTNDPATSISLSALLVILVSPYYLLTSAFWLSYMAVAGITIFVPALIWKEEQGHQTGWQKTRNKMLQTLETGIGLSYFTYPVILYNFYEYPLYSVLLNLLVVPLMTALLYAIIPALFIGMLHLKAGVILAYPCHIILQCYDFCCRFVQTLPGSSLVIGRPAVWQLVMFYVVTIAIWLFSGYIKTQEKSKLIKFQRPVTVFLMLLAVLLVSVRMEGGLRITLLDVGQGDGICVEDPKGGVYMVDGGSSSETLLGRYRILPFLKEKGIAEIHYWLISHPDLDHYSGLLELLQMKEESGIKIHSILLPAVEGLETEWEPLLTAAEECEVRVLRIARGEKIQNGKFILECLSPERGSYVTDPNAASIVLRLQYEELSMLLTGDADAENERELQGYYGKEMTENSIRKEIRILKAAHHGSNTSSCEEFLDWYQPDYVLISCGANNRYGHPHEEVLQRIRHVGAEIFRTDKAGAVIIERNRWGRIKISGFLNEMSAEKP